MAILSIQSHVAYGHVGNSAAVFPLQRLGFEVWPVHTVLFSNHPGYGAYGGAAMPVETVHDVVAGLTARGVMGQCDAVLSGYVGETALGGVILEAVEAARTANPAVRYVCDPVMGDEGAGLYVAADIPDFMRARAIPAADVALPNRFELELLTGRPAGDLSETRAAAEALRALGPETVVVTSLPGSDGADARIGMLLVTGEGAWRVETPRIDFPIPPNGAGDLTAALFTGFLLSVDDAPAALAKAAGAVYAILVATREAGGRELALVAAQEALANAPARFTAEALP